jgi:SpoVK/Ycf46/Vps4 family AAA+-type ATPase
MNAEMMKRVVRAIAERSQQDLDRLASKLVETERRTGHAKLADQLQAILKTPRPRMEAQKKTIDVPRKLTELPISRRNGESLATLFAPETLEHHMVLPASTEERFSRIEREYAARERLAKYGLKPRKTILLYGPPGCGKSLGAKRLAWSLGLPLMKVRFDSLISSYFGESGANLGNIFNAAKQYPCILLLDECDSIARSRMNMKDIGEASRVVNSLLQFMEEYDAPGLLVATTNIQESLDPALFRRFDDVFSLPLPGPEEIHKLLRSTLSAVPFAEMINWDRLVDKLSGASAAMVVKVAQDAAKAAVLAGIKGINDVLLDQAVVEMKRVDTKS